MLRYAVMEQGTMWAPNARHGPVSDDGPTVLAIRNVSKQFKIPKEKVETVKERMIRPRRRSVQTFEALKNVDFDISAGEFFGIVGRNGSGKSTLLKCIAGVYAPTTGTISARGRIATFIELGVGFNPELNAADNVILNATLLGLTAVQAREKLDEIIAFAELEEFVDMKLKNFSSGMHVRLAFSVALQAECDTLLIDEVLAVGDAAFQQKCFDTFHRLREENKTVVFVTHSMPMVERFCTRAIMLERGEIVSAGDPVNVALDYTQLNFDRSAEVGGGDERHGDRHGEIVDCRCEDGGGDTASVVALNDWLTIKVRVRFNEAMDDPVLGVLVRDDERRLAFHVDTNWSGTKTGRFSAGSEVAYEVRFQNHLGEGKYHISPSVAYSDGARMADVRVDLISFLSRGSNKSSGYVDLPYELRVGD